MVNLIAVIAVLLLFYIAANKEYLTGTNYFQIHVHRCYLKLSLQLVDTSKNYVRRQKWVFMCTQSTTIML